MVSWRKFLFILLTVLVSASTAQTQSLEPRTATCRFETPDNLTIDCYALSVPENRQSSNTQTISLYIAIVRNPSNNPHPDPVLFLQGGPGGSTLNSLDLTYDNRFEPLLATNRDIILFDQRGTGVSRPALTCDAYNRLENNLLDFQLDNESYSRLEIEELLNQALIDCGLSLANTNDLGGYTTRENAADIEVIRQAFGYEKLNLWGISYGTKLALTAMRDYPDSFRHIVLDSAYPLEANLYVELPDNFDRALQVLFENCLDNQDCNRTYPDLESVLSRTVEFYNERPLRFDAPNPYTGDDFEDVIFDGTTLLQSIFRLFYASEILPRLPQLIYDASEGELEVWRVLVGWLLAQRNNVALGMNYAVQCQEEFPFTIAGTIEDAWSIYPLFRDYRDTINNVRDLAPICDVFTVQQAHERENTPVGSSLPVLIVSGEYDPVTPPRWGQQVASNLSNSIYVEIPSHGHGPTGDEGCAQDIVIGFITTDNPSDIDTSCVGDIQMVFSGTQRGDFTTPDSASSRLGLPAMQP